MIGDPPILLPPTVPAPRDRFGISDAMILIAAVAFGLAWLRIEDGREVGWTFSTPGGGPSPTMSRLLRASGWFGIAVPLAGSVTLGLALVQLRRPGLFSASLFGRPGLLACLTASVPIVLYLVQWTIAGVAEGLIPVPNPPRFNQSPIDFMIFGRLSQLGYSAGVAVAATRLISRLGPRSGAPLGPIDRAGQVVGLCWMAMVACRLVLDALWSLCLGGLI